MSLESEDTIEIRTLMVWTQWCFFIWAENRKSVKLKIKSFQEIITNPPVYSHMLITRVLQGIFPLLLFGSLVLQLALREFKSIQQTDENIFFIVLRHVGAKSALLRRFFMLTHKKASSARPLALPFQTATTYAGSRFGLRCRLEVRLRNCLSTSPPPLGCKASPFFPS